MLRKSEGVDAQPVESALGEPLYCLSAPNSDRQEILDEADYEFIRQLDGTITTRDALQVVLELGLLPSETMPLVGRLLDAGLLEDPSGLWPDSSVSDTVAQGIESSSEWFLNLLWGRRRSAGRIVGNMGRRAARLHAILADPGGALLGFMALVAGAIVFVWGARSGRIIILPSGSIGGYVLGVLLIAFLCLSDLAALVEGAVREEPDERQPGRWRWRFYGGIPCLESTESGLLQLPWRQALLHRLTGVSFLGFVALTVSIACLFTAGTTVAIVLSSVAVADFVLAYLKLSPWWGSPLGQSVAQALPGMRLPWDGWTYVWRRLFPALLGRKEPWRQEVPLIVVGVLMILWPIGLLRLLAFIFQGEGVLWFRNIIMAEAGWQSVISLILVGSGAVLGAIALIAAGLLAATRLVHSLHLGSSQRILENSVPIAVGVGVVLSGGIEMAPEFVSPLLHLLTYLTLGVIGTFVCVRGLNPSRSNFLKFAIAGFALWFATNVFLSAAGVLDGQELGESARTFYSWGFLPPLCALSAVAAYYRSCWGKTTHWIWYVSAFTIALAFRLNFNPGAGFSAISGILAAAIFIGWARNLEACRYRTAALGLSGGLILIAAQSLHLALLPERYIEASEALVIYDVGIVGLCLVVASVLALSDPSVMRAEELNNLGENVPSTDRAMLYDGAGLLWSAAQLRVEDFAGPRASEAIRMAGGDVATSIQVDRIAFGRDGQENGELQVIADELDAIFSAAIPYWRGFCGAATIHQTLETRLRCMPWQQRQILMEQLVLRGTWWGAAAPAFEKNPTLEPEVVLRNNPSFAQLPESDFKKIVTNLRIEHHGIGVDVVRQNDVGECMYLVARGTADVYVSDLIGHRVHRATLHSGDMFGQLALLYATPRTATVTARTDLWTFRLDRSDVAKYLSADDASRRITGDAIRAINRLQDVALFQDLSHFDLEFIAGRSESVSFEPGELIIAEGGIGKDFFVIDQGNVLIEKDGVEINRRGPGEYFGEIAILFDVPRTATVTSISESSCIRVPSEVIRKFMGEQRWFRRRLERGAKRRLSLD